MTYSKKKPTRCILCVSMAITQNGGIKWNIFCCCICNPYINCWLIKEKKQYDLITFHGASRHFQPTLMTNFKSLSFFLLEYCIIIFGQFGPSDKKLIINILSHIHVLIIKFNVSLSLRAKRILFKYCDSQNIPISKDYSGEVGLTLNVREGGNVCDLCFEISPCAML